MTPAAGMTSNEGYHHFIFIEPVSAFPQNDAVLRTARKYTGNRRNGASAKPYSITVMCSPLVCLPPFGRMDWRLGVFAHLLLVHSVGQGCTVFMAPLAHLPLCAAKTPHISFVLAGSYTVVYDGGHTICGISRIV